MLDKYKLTAHRRIHWLADSAGRNTNALNESWANDEVRICRNTVQGRTSVTDDRGNLDSGKMGRLRYSYFLNETFQLWYAVVSENNICFLSSH